MSDQIVAELTVRERPYLHKLIPTAGHDEGNRLAGAETNAGNPLRVSTSLISRRDSVLALSKGIPKLDGLVTRSRNDLTIVYGKGNREDILGVSAEATGSLTAVDLPKAKGTIPRSRESELPIARDNNVRDEVRVSLKGAARVTECTRSI